MGRQQFTLLASALPVVTAPVTQSLTVGTTAVQLNSGTSAQAVSIDIQANNANSGIVYVGDNTDQKIALQKGMAYSVTAGLDVADYYVKGSTAGQVVNIMWQQVLP